MNSRFSVDELRALTLAPPFAFTKGLETLRIPAGEKYQGLSHFGDLLFDLDADPNQLHPLQDAVIEARMVRLLIRLMKENDAPAEQFVRLGLEA